jgi:hypothetical protein
MRHPVKVGDRGAPSRLGRKQRFELTFLGGARGAVLALAGSPLDMRTCVRVTSKGSITGQLQRALAKRDVLAVRSLAGEMPSVPLPLAVEITVLLSAAEPENYAPAARRLLARLAMERAMPLRQLADVAAT